MIINRQEIPEPYVWDETFATFYRQIDDEHKGLFNAIFDCAASPSNPKALIAMRSIMAEHFSNEQDIMENCNYANYLSHKARHTDFLRRLDVLRVPLRVDQIGYAKQWLVDHIRNVDFRYRGFLKSDTSHH